jgi:UDPglucose 6-dehydrogenase
MKSGHEPRALQVGVVGLGAVGKTLAHVLSWYHDVTPYDIKGDYAWDPVLQCELVLVCVDTPMANDGRLDCRKVDSVLDRLSKGGFGGTVAIRSTLRVGYMERAVEKYKPMRLVYFPEFIRERSRLQWTVSPDRLVVAGDARDVRVVLEAFSWVEDAVTLRMSFIDAEIGKLAHNAYIATKVSFTNEMERICAKYGADPENVMSVVTVDRRVRSKEHLRPHMGPYNGRCVPKDTHELRLAGDDSPLLTAVEEVRESFGKSREKVRPSVLAKSETDRAHAHGHA